MPALFEAKAKQPCSKGVNATPSAATTVCSYERGALLRAKATAAMPRAEEHALRHQYAAATYMTLVGVVWWCGSEEERQRDKVGREVGTPPCSVKRGRGVCVAGVCGGEGRAVAGSNKKGTVEGMCVWWCVAGGRQVSEKIVEVPVQLQRQVP